MADKNYGLVTAADVEFNGRDSLQEWTTHAARTNNGLTTVTEKQGFERYISFLGIVNFGFTLQAAWEGTAMGMSLIFLNGGPACLVWGTLLGGIGHTLVALSLGEMASMDPTVGAQYRWSSRFARSYPEFWGLVQGWITTFAWIVTVPAVLMTLGYSTQALISFHSTMYIPEAWHITLFMWAFMVAAIIGNLYLRRILNALETIGGICHLLFFVACVTILTTLAERKSASYVFSRVVSEVSGWKNAAVSFQTGLLVPLLPLSGYDSVLHMIDETKRPRERVPKSMIWAVLSNSTLQFGYMITLMFCLGDEAKVAEAQQPVLEIYYQATKSKTAATVVFLMHMSIIIVGLFNISASAIRLTWAFARDKGLPFPQYFTHINQQYQIPLGSLALVSIISVLISFINLGSSVALGAIMAVPTVALFISYFIPIAHLTVRKLHGEHPRYGPFKLGRWGLPINLFSLCFCAYCAFWSAFPTSYPVAAQNMNYAGPILIGLISLCCLDWFTSGSKRFVVPTGTYNIEMEDKREMSVRKGSGQAPSK